MEILLPILLIPGAVLIGAMSPGPSFVLIASISVKNSRRDGLSASLGMGVGGVIYATLSLLGLHALLTAVPTLYLLLKVIGGLYLIYLAICIWRGANEPMVVESSNMSPWVSIRKSFLLGLFTQISNPKTAIVYASIFAALLPAEIPDAVFYSLPVLIFLVEAGWYFIVAFIFSSKTPRGIYLKSKSVFDRIAATVMFGLGVRLLSSANSS